jgi:hypothetical protein
MTCILNVVLAFGWAEAVEQLADRAPQAFNRAFGSRSEQFLELGESLFDWIEIGRIWRQIAELGVLGLDRLADALNLVGGEIVHDDDVAGLQPRGEHLLDPGAEGQAVPSAVC